MLAQFPFKILGFHADNGSEYVNHRVAKMLEKLKVEFTRSRPRRSNDNGLAETKNGAVVRKEFGYSHIPQHHAAHFNTYCIEYLNPFLNFHRPCLFSKDKPDPKKPGRIKRIYRPQYAMTPLYNARAEPKPARRRHAGALARAGHRADGCSGGRGTQRSTCRSVQTRAFADGLSPITRLRGCASGGLAGAWN